jgi:stress-induced morphogen
MLHSHQTQAESIKKILETHGFRVLSCINVSSQHSGHQGHHQESHFDVVLESSFTTRQERFNAHKKAMSLFADAIPHPIHALSIRFVARKDY